MALEIVGAGFGRTGTMSLKAALEQLGYHKCYHMMEVEPQHLEVWRDAQAGRPVEWDALFDGYKASVDWPSCNSWHELMTYYPQAKVILTTRDPQQWYRSVMKTIYPSSTYGLTSEDPKRRAGSEWGRDIIWDGVFDGRLDDDAHVIDVFNRHNENVRQTVPADRLLEYQPGDGWEPLCAFLGCEVPESSYPRTNSTEDFLARWSERTGVDADELAT